MVVASAAYAAGQVVGVAVLVAVVTCFIRTFTHDDPLVPDEASGSPDE